MINNFPAIKAKKYIILHNFNNCVLSNADISYDRAQSFSNIDRNWEISLVVS